MSEAWFKPKTHGYGASPTGWRGWAFTIGFGLVQVALALVLLWPVGQSISVVRIVLWCAASILGTIWFIRVCRIKTDGEWRWRWGEKG